VQETVVLLCMGAKVRIFLSSAERTRVFLSPPGRDKVRGENPYLSPPWGEIK
jgi:hypothetical protein